MKKTNSRRIANASNSAATTITNTNSLALSAVRPFTNQRAMDLSRVHFERLRNNFDQSAADLQKSDPRETDPDRTALYSRKTGVSTSPLSFRAKSRNLWLLLVACCV